MSPGVDPTAHTLSFLGAVTENRKVLGGNFGLGTSSHDPATDFDAMHKAETTMMIFRWCLMLMTRSGYFDALCWIKPN